MVVSWQLNYTYADQHKVMRDYQNMVCKQKKKKQPSFKVVYTIHLCTTCILGEFKTPPPSF